MMRVRAPERHVRHGLVLIIRAALFVFIIIRMSVEEGLRKTYVQSRPCTSGFPQLPSFVTRPTIHKLAFVLRLVQWFDS